jgi:hypothetical protein
MPHGRPAKAISLADYTRGERPAPLGTRQAAASMERWMSPESERPERLRTRQAAGPPHNLSPSIFPRFNNSDVFAAAKSHDIVKIAFDSFRRSAVSIPLISPLSNWLEDRDK